MAESKGGPSKSTRRVQTPLVKNYLITYNVIETIGWLIVLYKTVLFYAGPQASQATLYKSVEWWLIIFQNAAVLEIVHAAIKIVPSNPVLTAIQVASRVVVVCGILIATQAGRDTIGLTLALFAWSITEVIRYGNYALNLLGVVPYLVTWLRYSTFIILYPIGITGELLCIYAAQKEIGETKLWTVEMPNAFNFIFDYQKFLWFLMILYIPLFPQLYFHMFSLRKKVLGRTKKEK